MTNVLFERESSSEGVVHFKTESDLLYSFLSKETFFLNGLPISVMRSLCENMILADEDQFALAKFTISDFVDLSKECWVSTRPLGRNMPTFSCNSSFGAATNSLISRLESTSFSVSALEELVKDLKN